MARKREVARVSTYLPPSMKEWLAARADKHLSSMNTEIVAAVRAFMKQVEAEQRAERAG